MKTKFFWMSMIVLAVLLGFSLFAESKTKPVVKKPSPVVEKKVEAVAPAAPAIMPTAAPKQFNPNETQTLRLQLIQTRAVLAQKDADLEQAKMELAQHKQTETIQAIFAEGEKIKKENSWPASVELDINTLRFNDRNPAPTTPVVPTPKN